MSRRCPLHESGVHIDLGDARFSAWRKCFLIEIAVCKMGRSKLPCFSNGVLLSFRCAGECFDPCQVVGARINSVFGQTLDCVNENTCVADGFNLCPMRRRRYGGGRLLLETFFNWGAAVGGLVQLVAHKTMHATNGAFRPNRSSHITAWLPGFASRSEAVFQRNHLGDQFGFFLGNV